jgi:hypothetical protein
VKIKSKRGEGARSILTNHRRGKILFDGGGEGAPLDQPKIIFDFKIFTTKKVEADKYLGGHTIADHERARGSM